VVSFGMSPRCRTAAREAWHEAEDQADVPRPPPTDRRAVESGGGAAAGLAPPAGAPSDPAESSGERPFGQLAAALDELPFRQVHLLVLAMVAFGTLVNAVEEYDAGLAAPLIAREWNLSDARVGLLTTFTFAGVVLGSLVAGAVGDRHGRPRDYLYNLALYTVGAPLAALAPGFGWLLCARFAVGLGLGGELNTGLTLVAEVMPSRYRGVALGTVNVAGGGLGSSPRPRSPPSSWDRSRRRWVVRPSPGAGSSASSRCPPWCCTSTGGRCPSRPATCSSMGGSTTPTGVVTAPALNRLRLPPGVPTTGFLSQPPAALGLPRRIPFRGIFSHALARRTTVLRLVCSMTFGAQVTTTVFLPTLLPG
jgi:hypothetical protein